MKQLQAEHGEVVVRIGTTGVGENPYYRVDDAESGRLIEAFDGVWGRPWKNADGRPYTGQFHAQNWSECAMTYEEVGKLDKQLRAKARMS